MAERTSGFTQSATDDGKVSAVEIVCALVSDGEANTLQASTPCLTQYSAYLNLHILQTAIGAYGEHTEHDLDECIQRLKSQPITKSILELTTMSELNDVALRNSLQSAVETEITDTAPLYTAIALMNIKDDPVIRGCLMKVVLLERIVSKASLPEIRRTIVRVIESSPSHPLTSTTRSLSSFLSIKLMNQRIAELEALLPSHVSARCLYESGYTSATILPLKIYNEFTTKRAVMRALPGCQSSGQLNDYSSLPIQEAVKNLKQEILLSQLVAISMQKPQSAGEFPSASSIASHKSEIKSTMSTVERELGPHPPLQGFGGVASLFVFVLNIEKMQPLTYYPP